MEKPVMAQVATPSSSENNSLTSSVEDFSTLTSDKSVLSAKSQYNQVIFHDLSEFYPTDSDIVCRYSLADNIQPQPGDKIALFKVAWTSVSEYITFVRAPLAENLGSGTLCVTFKAETLPKVDKELYQLCYVTCGNVIVGVSTAFCFHKPNENELIGIEDPGDPDLVVFRSRVTYLQDELNKRYEDHNSLIAEHKLLSQNFNVLKKELDKNESDIKELKNKVVELEKQKEDLIKDKKTAEERLQDSSQLMDELKKTEDELKSIISNLKQEVSKSSVTIANQDQMIETLMKKTKTLENETKSLAAQKEDKDMISLELNKTCQSLQSVRNELEITKSTLNCLEVERKCREKELTDQVKINEELSNENQILKDKQKKLAEGYNLNIAEKDGLLQELNKTKNQMEVLQKQNADIVRQLEYLQGKETDPSWRKEEFEMIAAELSSLQEYHQQCEAKINSLEQNLNYSNEEHEKEMNKLIKEKVELQEKNRDLQIEVRELLKFDPAGDIYGVFKGACSHLQNVFEKPRKSQEEKEKRNQEKLSEEQKEGDQACLLSKMQKLQQEKSDLRSELIQVRHEKYELEKILQESKEENAALKSRISVLEYELSTLKKQSQLMKPVGANEPPITKHIDELNKNLSTLTNFVSQQVYTLEDKLQKESEEKKKLQEKVEYLLKSDSDMCQNLLELEMKFKAVCNENQLLRVGSTDRIHMEFVKVSEERANLERQLAQLRANAVGKINVVLTRDLQREISVLKKNLQDKVKSAILLIKYINTELINYIKFPLACPLCSDFKIDAPELCHHLESHIIK